RIDRRRTAARRSHVDADARVGEYEVRLSQLFEPGAGALRRVSQSIVRREDQQNSCHLPLSSRHLIHSAPGCARGYFVMWSMNLPSARSLRVNLPRVKRIE